MFDDEVVVVVVVVVVYVACFLTLSAAPPGKMFLTTAPLFRLPLIPNPNPLPSLVNTIT